MSAQIGAPRVRQIPYMGVEMREFNRVHLHKGDQPCWGDGKRVLKVCPPQRAWPDGRAFMFEPNDEFPYSAFFLPEELGTAAAAKVTDPSTRGCHECAWGKVAGCWRCGSISTGSTS